MKKFLFICGTPRSGTTYLANLIGTHPQIVMGVERFKFHYSRRTLAPELFGKDRFFDLRAEDTSLPERVALPQIEVMSGKYDGCVFLGDKYPNLVKYLHLVESRFPDPTILVALRNPLDVGKSWEARANNPNDRWPSSNDFAAGVRYWTQSIQSLTKARSSGMRILIMDYDLLANAPADSALAHFRAIFDALGLQTPPELAAELLRSRRQTGFMRDGSTAGCTEDMLSAVRQALQSRPWSEFVSAFAPDGVVAPAWVDALSSGHASDGAAA